MLVAINMVLGTRSGQPIVREKMMGSVSSATRFCLGAIGLLFSIAAHAQQSWDYVSYPDGQGVVNDVNKPLYRGYITLDETGPKPIFRMYSGKVTQCFDGSIEAQVKKTADETVIVVKRDLKGCGSARFVVKNDGSGGRREILQNGVWKWDGFERGLTLRKG
jgi:hypothetical protein